ncbi:MAG: YdeI/OmpD-associated family protein [Daejeonella sp.]
MEIKEFTTHIQPVEGPMLHHVMPVPQNIVDEFGHFKNHLRIFCRFGKAKEFPCALSKRDSLFVIAISKKLMKEAGVNADEIIHVYIRVDEDNGLALPEELKEVLLQDDLGSKLYDELSDGYKRGYIYYISQAKSIDMRIQRALKIINKLKTGR